MKTIKRQKEREYTRNQNSSKYRKLLKNYKELKKKATENFIRNKIENLRHTNPSKFFLEMKEVKARPSETP